VLFFNSHRQSERGLDVISPNTHHLSFRINIKQLFMHIPALGVIILCPLSSIPQKKKKKKKKTQINAKYLKSMGKKFFPQQQKKGKNTRYLLS